MKKGLLVVIGVLLFILVGVAVYYSMSNGSNKVSDTQVIVYNTTISYRITKNKDKVNVKYEAQIQCVQAPCNPIKQDYNLNFNKDNMNKVYKLFERLGNKDGSEATITNDSLTAEEKKTIEAIITNDESNFDQEPQATGNLYFTLRYNNMNCPTIILTVNRDNTYELVTGTKKENIVTKTGTYDYKVSDLVNASDISFKEGYHYTLTLSDGTNEYIDDNNQYLKEFLSRLEINLQECQKFEE